LLRKLTFDGECSLKNKTEQINKYIKHLSKDTRMSYYSGPNTFPSLKPGFHMVRMETLPERSQTIRATETTSIAWIELSSIRTIGTIVKILKRLYGSALRRLRRSGRSKEGFFRNHHFYSSNREQIRAGWR